MESEFKSLSIEKVYSKNNFFLTKFNVSCYGPGICFPLLFLRALYRFPFPMSVMNFDARKKVWLLCLILGYGIDCFVWLESVRMMGLLSGNN